MGDSLEAFSNQSGLRHEDEASPFLPICQPSLGFGDIQLNGLELSMLLVLFLRHAEPEEM